jgi:hypothetical protein
MKSNISVGSAQAWKEAKRLLLSSLSGLQVHGAQARCFSLVPAELRRLFKKSIFNVYGCSRFRSPPLNIIYRLCV